MNEKKTPSYLPRFLHLEKKHSLSIEEIVPDFDQRGGLLDDAISKSPVHFQALEAEAGPVVELN